MTSQQPHTVIIQLYNHTINHNGLGPENICNYILYHNDGLSP